MSKPPIDDPYYDRLHTFLDATSAETDRGRALIVASLIEEMLEEVLKAYLMASPQTKKLFEGPNATISSLHSKALLCRSLSLITKQEYADIDLVRKIRNQFAHNVLCSFEDQKVKDWAAKLNLGMSVLDALEESHKSRVDDPKGRFGMVTVSIITSLYNRRHYVEKSRITETNFPE
jgi:mannitol operon repressor